MSFRFTERRDSRASTTTPPTYLARYIAAGSNDPSFVKAYAAGLTPEVVATAEGILYRENISVMPRGYNSIDVEIAYGSRQNKTGEYRLSFDTQGGTVHLTNSRQTVASYGTSPPDHKQAIGVEGDDVKGVDVVIPALVVNVHFKHPLGVITLDRIKTFAQYTGSVNSAPFLSFATGEVLFLGCRGTEGSDTETEIEYSFAMSQNISNLTIGDLTITEKQGHDYLWIAYKPAVSNNRAAQQPEFGYVERIYPRADLATVLGFG